MYLRSSPLSPPQDWEKLVKKLILRPEKLLWEMKVLSVRILLSHLRPRTPNHSHKGGDSLSWRFTKSQELEERLREGVKGLPQGRDTAEWVAVWEACWHLAKTNLNRTATQPNLMENLPCPRHVSNCSNTLSHLRLTAALEQELENVVGPLSKVLRKDY